MVQQSRVMARAIRHSRWFTPLLVVMAMILAIANAALADHPADSGFAIDGIIADAGATQLSGDGSGSAKEVGPLTSTQPSSGVIHNDSLRPGKLQPQRASGSQEVLVMRPVPVGGTDWLYFAWERDSTNGSGAGHRVPTVSCAGGCVAAATVGRPDRRLQPLGTTAEGDFLLVWDQVGGKIQISKRVFDGTIFGAPDVLTPMRRPQRLSSRRLEG